MCVQVADLVKVKILKMRYVMDTRVCQEPAVILKKKKERYFNKSFKMIAESASK